MRTWGSIPSKTKVNKIISTGFVNKKINAFKDDFLHINCGKVIRNPGDDVRGKDSPIL